MDQPRGIVVKYSADKMKAFVALSNNFGPVTAGMVLTELLHKGVVHGLNTFVIHKTVTAGYFDKYVEVAAGTPAKPGVDGRIDILAGGAKGGQASAGEPAPAFDGVAVIKAGTPLARRVPPVPGVDGMDIFGNAIPAAAVKDAAFVGGGGGVVSPPNDPNLLIAVRDGAFKYGAGGLIEVHPYREIDGDVAAATGKVSFTGDLKITGTVRSGAVVDVSGMLMILGGVEGAVIRCGGSLTVGEGVRGAGGAVIECGGGARLAFIDGAKFTANGAVTVTGDIVNSTVNAKGLVKARNIVGGKVTAAGGVSAVTVGNEEGLPTEIDVGVIHRYASERTVARSNLETQNLLSEGYISELFCFVRDNMDANGVISQDMAGRLETYKQSLANSNALCREFEKNLDELEELLKELADCSISAMEIHPNVLLKLGFADQQVKEGLRNVLLKPSGAR